MVISEKDKRLKEIITELAHDFELDDHKFQKYVEEFRYIYSNNYRHEYSDITRVLFSIEKDEERDFLPQKIKDIKDNISEVEIKKGVNKLWDHINLENIRLRELRKISENARNDVKDFQNKVDEVNEQAQNTQVNVKKINKRVNQVNKKMETAQTSYVSILGIFSSITFALFGGLNILAQVFDKVANINNHNVFLGVMVIAGFVVFSIFNLLNLLLYSIGRIVNRDIISRQCSKSCNKSVCDCKLHKKLFIKYTHISIINITLIILICVFLITYLCG
ncbi:hypothetical protein NL50_17300 [Clostridium acetobutylicum]|nr:hypothetical protein NL50_17300 [Clostridium acetobutylicum]